MTRQYNIVLEEEKNSQKSETEKIRETSRMKEERLSQKIKLFCEYRARCAKKAALTLYVPRWH